MFDSQFADIEKPGELSQPMEAKVPHKKLLPHERYGIKKRKYEEVIRSPFVQSKASKVPNIDELRNRKNLLDPVMLQMLRQVRPWVEVRCLLCFVLIFNISLLECNCFN